MDDGVPFMVGGAERPRNKVSGARTPTSGRGLSIDVLTLRSLQLAELKFAMRRS